jgi:hypothetical protein
MTPNDPNVVHLLADFETVRARSLNTAKSILYDLGIASQALLRGKENVTQERIDCSCEQLVSLIAYLESKK